MHHFSLTTPPTDIARGDTLKAGRPRLSTMHVTVDVAGGTTKECDLSPDATYADLLRAVDLSPYEAAALVDGRPVPEDAPVEATEVRVLRLVQGG